MLRYEDSELTPLQFWSLCVYNDIGVNEGEVIVLGSEVKTSGQPISEIIAEIKDISKPFQGQVSVKDNSYCFPTCENPAEISFEAHHCFGESVLGHGLFWWEEGKGNMKSFYPYKGDWMKARFDILQEKTWRSSYESPIKVEKAYMVYKDWTWADIPPWNVHIIKKQLLLLGVKSGR